MTVWQPSVPVIEFIDILGKGIFVAGAALCFGAACFVAVKAWENGDG